MRLAGIIAASIVLAASQAPGQDCESVPSATTRPLPAAEEPTGKSWSFTASAYTYFLPESSDYIQPTIAADHGWLHLEARYNYEGQKAGSAWLGYNFSGGKKVEWEFTPMFGGVVGNVTGVAPGYKGSLSLWKLEFYSEGERVFDTRDSTRSFFYNWSEMTLAPRDWFRFGLVTQRTRAYQSDRDIQRGILAGFSYKRLDLTTCVFNPDESRPLILLGAAVSC
jgi:hypothetical protein